MKKHIKIIIPIGIVFSLIIALFIYGIELDVLKDSYDYRND